MKNIQSFNRYARLFMLMAIPVLIFSCKKYLTVTPQDRVTDEVVWTDPIVADFFLNDIYNSTPIWHTAYRTSDHWTDDCMNNQFWQGTPELIRSGNYSPSAYISPGGIYYTSGEWGYERNFQNVRKCNVFISKIIASELPEAYKKSRIAEARFLRAWFYFYLMNYYGGVSIITEPQDVSEGIDSIAKPRATETETADFISSECELAAADLPVREGEAGRATQGAALSLKAFAELVTASPLNNPGNDADKWQRAAASYKQVMDMGLYSLFPSYDSLWLEENNGNTEAIFTSPTRYPRSNFDPDDRYLEDAWGPVNVDVNGVLTTISIVTAAPTQDVVDSYRMEDGKTITESPLYDAAHPYDHRESRFYKSIVYDGAVWKNTIITTRRGGNNAVDRTRTQWITPTGYYIIKTLDPRINGLLDRPGGRKNRNDWPLTRYAEVLLGYAEAQNEAVGPDNSVYEAINAIRMRGGLPRVETSYGAVSQDKMREIIRNERRVELFCEGKRFFDLLRWKIAETKLNGFVRGVEVVDVAGTLTYNYFDVAAQAFHPEKNYRWPIPSYVIDRNPKLEQNPGY